MADNYYDLASALADACREHAENVTEIEVDASQLGLNKAIKNMQDAIARIEQSESDDAKKTRT